MSNQLGLLQMRGFELRLQGLVSTRAWQCVY